MSTTTATPDVNASDVIDGLLGSTPGDHIDTLRSLRPDARANAQRSYEALFQPVDASEFSLAERYAVATFVAGLHRDARLTSFYAAGVENPEQLAAVEAEIAAGKTEGPYGTYRETGLQSENQPGLEFEVTDAGRAALGDRLTAALEHAHFLVFHPRDSRPERLEKLLSAGWSTTGIVTLSQLIAFLTFQIRIVAGLSQLSQSTKGA
ncbi:CMD domain protein [Lysinibacter cavernae]|uniref:CMD domain protein n=1 Tax=Lysinibacter cavernae TaxID=1640652 RepID=A0A7X5TTD2_9MICO|nr:CMD domain protein [Lysinibacter cavernae]NIH54501.1 CMD domain protein [Lysinibacter cavernae]